MRQSSITRTDLYTATAGIAAGVAVSMFTGDWRWLLTCLLLAATAGMIMRLRERGLGLAVLTATVAILLGIVLWLWTGDARWAVLGLFPLVFVLIRRLADRIEPRR